MDDKQLSRKSFLDWVIRIGGVASLGSVLYPTIRYLSPLERKGSDGPTELTADELAKIESAKYVVTRVGMRKVLVLRDPTGTLRALDAKCTHEGCLVQYLPGQAIIFCGCHNGRFDLDGRVLGGPPPRPLAQHEVVADAKGHVIVTVRPS